MGGCSLPAAAILTRTCSVSNQPQGQLRSWNQAGVLTLGGTEPVSPHQRQPSLLMNASLLTTGSPPTLSPEEIIHSTPLLDYPLPLTNTPEP